MKIGDQVRVIKADEGDLAYFDVGDTGSIVDFYTPELVRVEFYRGGRYYDVWTVPTNYLEVI